MFSFAPSPPEFVNGSERPETTESGSRFNRFHAISTTPAEPFVLPSDKKRLSHTGVSPAAGTNPVLPVWQTKATQAAGFVSRNPSFPTCVEPQYKHVLFWSEVSCSEIQTRWVTVCLGWTKSGGHEVVTCLQCTVILGAGTTAAFSYSRKDVNVFVMFILITNL